jgi:hypothetical protein
MAIMKELYERQPGCFNFLFLFFYRFLVCVFVLVWFENKVPSFSHLDTKDGSFPRVVVSYALLFTRKIVEKICVAWN